MADKKHIHFMGISGSGMSAIAQIAHARGYSISGCDLNLDSPYFSHLKSQIPNLKAFTGHSASHLKGVDILAVTPAVFYQSSGHPEVETAKKRKILMKWQDFMGTYLHRGKYVICIAGTHGKSTTTALTGLLLEKAGLDPTVEIGATVKDWHNNVRIGRGKYFITEADEFHDNFATYRPDILILTLVEYDHPEFFGSYKNMLGYYRRLLSRIRPGGTLIYNTGSPGCISLVNQIANQQITTIGYSLADFPKNLQLSQPGNHNKLNALAVLKLAGILKIPSSVVYSTLRSFTGLERRLDLIGEKKGIKVYDDYANHPSSFTATIASLKELYPGLRIWAVVEPHTFSRLRSMLTELPAALSGADQVIVSKIFPSREKDPGDFTGQNIVDAMHHPHAIYIPEFSDIVSYIINHQSSIDIVLVMGSGNSHKLARQIFENL